MNELGEGDKSLITVELGQGVWNDKDEGLEGDQGVR